IKQRKIALLVHNGVNASSIDDIKIWAEAEKAIVETLAPNAAPVKSSDDNEIPVDGRQNGEPSVTYDAIIVIDGNNLEVFKADGVSKHYVLETYKHLKPIVFLGDKCALIDEFQLTKDAALFSTQNFKEIQDQFKQAIQNHRLWDREKVVATIPA
ncbi:catalase HPII, partial [Acinetobacter johnsonii]|nr:catalase HPII [Acinetobacter johnsonii]